MVYLWITWDQTIWFLAIYDKDEATYLTTQQRKVLRNMVEAELAARRRQQQRKKS